ncbi:DUF1600 domain-containing protein [Ureaplasma zalophigenitalium]|uniref:DUF1600 domain-containing protein n=1 Tax=Ureaplasma zalophigenitalium TaxID=907723 RepID=A0ABT3BNV8_9BACT|nr:DUF1600 domain-containing protein [Ureaplasma zalophigenitalium]MCV3753930.1 DUF1600 domain-containing protein [Ureaplasma zalophigenitalium]
MFIYHNVQQKSCNDVAINVKMFNLTWLNNLFLILGISFLSIYLSSGYERNNIVYDISFIHYKPIQSIGAVGLYCFLWYACLNVISLIFLCGQTYSNKKTFFCLLIGILFINPWAYVYWIKNFGRAKIYWIITFYHILNPSNKIEFDIKNKKSIIALCYLIISIGFMVFSSIDYVPVNLSPGINIIDQNTPMKIIYTQDLWFNNLHYFTTQGNWLCICIAFFIFINPNARFLKQGFLLLVGLTYISIISIIWLTAIFPFAHLAKKYLWVNYLTGFYNHLITPFAFHVLCWYIFRTQKICNQFKYLHAWRLFISYLILYTLYALMVPLIGNVSVYGLITNLWTNVNGQLVYLAFLFIFLLFANFIFFVFFAIVCRLQKIKLKITFKPNKKISC